MRRLSMIFAICICLCMSGCEVKQPDPLPEEPPVESTTRIDRELENIIDQKANEVHVPAELSDDFVSRYLNVKDLETMKLRVKHGIAITNEKAGMTEKEYQLWKDLIQTKQIQMYTVNDLEQKYQEMEHALQILANDKQKDLDQLLKQDYGLTPKETESFLKKQAEKYIEPEVELLE